MRATDLILPVVYALAALVVVAARRVTRRDWQPTQARFWGVLAVVLLGLAVVKLPLVPASWGEEVRAWFDQQGWYTGRRPVQAAALVGLGLVGLTATAVVARRVVRAGLPLAPVVGAAILVLHTLVRALSYHAADAILSGQMAPGVRVATVVQVVGLVLVVGPAAWSIGRKRS